MMKNVMMIKTKVVNNTDYNPIYQTSASVGGGGIISIKKGNVYRNTGGALARYSQSGSFAYSLNSSNSGWLYRWQTDIMFNEDGTRMFSVHNDNGSFIGELITNPYGVAELGVATYGPNEPHWTQLFFGDNGNKFYFTNSSGQTHQYNLYTPYKPYSGLWAWLEGTFIRQTTSIGYIQLSEDGTKAYKIESNNLKEYDLNTPWNLSTISFNRDMPLGSGFSFNGRFEIYGGWLRAASTTDLVHIYSI